MMVRAIRRHAVAFGLLSACLSACEGGGGAGLALKDGSVDAGPADAAPSPDSASREDAAPPTDAAPPDGGMCVDGTLGCPCTAGGLCGFTEAGDPLTCVADVCVEPECAPGATGCTCDDGACAAADDACEQGVCRPVECVPGASGCPCEGGATCDAAGDVCDGGLCTPAGCDPGTTACTCDAGACDAPGDVCRDGVCQPSGCAAGDLGCPCLNGVCDPGLACDDGLCIDNTGGLGGPCFANATCHPGFDCREAICVPCREGARGCFCGPGDACAGDLACVDGFCADREIRGDEPPAVARCFTPCTGGYVNPDTGRYVSCPADGLMPGCHLDGRACREGSCLLPDEAPRACVSDYECPDFQTCRQGRCWSTCAGDDECGAGQRCHRKVCRDVCDGLEAPRRGDFTCQSIDAATTLYLPAAPSPEERIDTGPPAAVALSRTIVGFTNVTNRASFAIVNETNVRQTYTVRKLSHVATFADGTTEERLHADASEVCDAQRECPLTWLNLGEVGAGQRTQSVDVVVPANGRIDVEISAADGRQAVRWIGALEVTHPTMGKARVDLSYTQSAEGQWKGNMYFFGRFGTSGLPEWLALPHGARTGAPGTRDEPRAYNRVGNALVRTWAAFRNLDRPLPELQAVLQALRNETWSLPQVDRDCRRQFSAQTRCYLFEGGRNGLKSLTDDQTTNPVPSGAVDLPIAINLRTDPQDPLRLIGRINSADTLHYAGDPAATIRLATPTTQCTRDARGACLVLFDVGGPDVVDRRQPIAHVNVGGRFELPSGQDDCPAGFELVDIPWLVEGFERNTLPDPALGLSRRECRSQNVPYADADKTPINVQLAASNPIPDGRARRRTLYLLDGALINGDTIFLLFEERFESFLGEEDASGFSSYGYMLLTREPTELDPSDADGRGGPDAYQGATPGEPQAEPEELLAVACDTDLVGRVAGLDDAADDPAAVVQAILDGVDRREFEGCIDLATPGGDDQPCLPEDERVHSFCQDNGKFDDGGEGRPCPIGSEVVYFTVHAGAPDPALHPCNQRGQPKGTCQAELTRIKESPDLAQYEPAWVCREVDQVVCNDDRADLVAERVFFPAVTEAGRAPLLSRVARAFRYKTRFRNRQGANIGFAPQVCVPDSDAIPYCYDPIEIEAIRGEVDCLLAIAGDDALYGRLSQSLRTRLAATLEETFSIGPVPRPANLPPAALRDGFERLYAELLVMQGDEAFTRAFGSRFDLAGVRAAPFSGTRFEVGGIDLSGPAGAEMRFLYLATQYYREALGRFYALAPTIYRAVRRGANDPRNFVKPEIVTAYLERLVRASTQKTRAASAIAERYRNLDRPDLARRVLEREYTAAYLESVVLSRMMEGIVPGVPAEARDQIRRFVEDAHRRYRAAMLEMRNAYREIADHLNYFGLPPGHIPFPTVDVRETNAFENMLFRAEQRLRLARDREDVAIASDRGFESDAAEFESELIRIRNTYESQLREICGSFNVDGNIYPATQKYADQLPGRPPIDDPCGVLGNGDLFSASANAEIAALDIQKVITQVDNVLAEVDIEMARVAAQCALLRVDAMQHVSEVEGERITLADVIRDANFDKNRMQSAVQAAGQIASLSSNVTNCFAAGPISAACIAKAEAVAGIYGLAHAGLEVGITLSERKINNAERDLQRLEAAEARWQLDFQCRQAEVDSSARTKALKLRLAELRLEGLRAEYQLRLAFGEMQRLRNRATRLQLEQQEAEQLAINAAAARNDPNIRIYRNDAILNADFAFQAALREAYRATLVFEYYTSQSYARKGDLYLVRLVSRGEQNLENYLADLNNAFFEFEEEFGLPNTRLLRLSLLDDILSIPRLDESGRELSSIERVALMRAKLTDPAFLDDRGYLSFPFQTRLEQVSPVTRNHKVRFIEAEINANSPGDSFARLYLEQAGTNVIRAVEGGERVYYRLPPVRAVLNPFFDGGRPFAPEVYANERLRDRPLIATNWRLILNQRDELANLDLDLSTLNDIKLFVYYTDFTEF